MKHHITFLIVFLPLVTWGQKVSFSTEILNSNDTSIIAVKELWEAYVDNSRSGFSKTSQEYWNQYEPAQGFTDIVLAQCGMPSYLIGELEVYDIQRVDGGFFRIRNKWSVGDGENITRIADFSIYAKYTSSGYKLYNHFFLARSELKTFKVGNIHYFYPSNYPFNSQRATQMSELYSEISTKYGFTKPNKVIYIVGNNIDEANHFIGFDYTFMNSPFQCAAYIIREMNIIIASVDDHQHEIIHTLFKPEFPDAHPLFHEGIATYYGGSCDKDITYLIGQLKKMIENNPNIDLSKIDELNAVLDDGTNYYYTIGALFIDYALRIGGIEKVLALFEQPRITKNTSDDAFSAIKEELGIERSKIDGFIRKYVDEYSF